MRDGSGRRKRRAGANVYIFSTTMPLAWEVPANGLALNTEPYTRAHAVASEAREGGGEGGRRLRCSRVRSWPSCRFCRPNGCHDDGYAVDAQRGYHEVCCTPQRTQQASRLSNAMQGPLRLVRQAGRRTSAGGREKREREKRGSANSPHTHVDGLSVVTRAHTKSTQQVRGSPLHTQPKRQQRSKIFSVVPGI